MYAITTRLRWSHPFLQKNGKRVPEDISVTGYDNSVIAEGAVGLTTIAHPQEKLGEMAAELLLEKIRKGARRKKAGFPV